MSHGDEPARLLEEHRVALTSLAQRLLGAGGPVDEAVQEAGLRLARADPEQVGDRGRWLSRAVVRRCLELLRQGSSREDTLSPAERVAFVLHDLCGMPIGDVAAMLGRTTTATGQLAGRARRRVQTPELTWDADRAVQGRVVDAFLAASRAGDLEELAWLLHPDAVLHADAAAVAAGAVPEARGAPVVAETFADQARLAGPAVLDGFPAAVAAVGGRPGVVFGFTVVDGRIAEVEQLADGEVLPLLDLAPGSAAP